MLGMRQYFDHWIQQTLGHDLEDLLNAVRKHSPRRGGAE
jgi:hypothetical protein